MSRVFDPPRKSQVPSALIFCYPYESVISVVYLVSVYFVVDVPSVEPYMYEMFQKHGDVHIK